MKIKKLVCALLLCAILAASFTIPSFAEEITVKVDGKKLEMSVPARIENDRTLVPMRAIFEALGMTVTWDDGTKTVTADDGEKNVTMTIGKKEIVKDGKVIEIDAAPIISNDTTLVPVRAVSESLDASVEWDNDTKTVEIESAEYQMIKEAWKDNVGSIDLSAMTVTGEGISVEGKVVEITEGGDFTVTGTNSDAMIHVDTKDRVKLRLSGMNLTNSTGPAIYYENADKAYITVSKDTENFIADGEEYSVDAKAAIYSSADIEIKGSGTLNVTSALKHAIASKDDIEIEEGTLILRALVGDGIHANEKIKISGGNISITANGDGIQAEENVVIEGGVIDITTTGVVEETEEAFGEMNPGQRPMGNMGQPQGGRGGMQPPETGEGQNPEEREMPQGTPPEMPDGENFAEKGMRSDMQPPETGEGQIPEGGEMPREIPPERNFGGNGENMQPPEMGEEAVTTAEAEDGTTTSSKGIKAETDFLISGGEITVNSTEHCLHCAAEMTISGGKTVLASQKGKGISAHGNLDISGGEITVTKSTEGIESKAVMTISGGKIDVTASDDGINCGGTGSRNAEESAAHALLISGGEIYVNASGDGLDSNGSIEISGGNIIVEGPTNNGNGAIDAESDVRVSGGTLLAIGASGMAMGPGAESTQASFSYTIPSGYASGEKISVADASGKILISYVTTKTGGNIIFSSPELKVGETYTLSVGENSYTIELTSTVTGADNGNMRGFGGKGGRKNMGKPRTAPNNGTKNN